jgi:hypothetical protein
MPWYALLIIGLVSLAIVIGGFAYMGLKGWRLAKKGMSISRRVAPLADGLSRQAAGLSTKAEQLQANGEQLAVNVARLQTSLARLQVVSAAASEASQPLLLLTGWLSGDRGNNDWRRWSRGQQL